MIELTRTVKLVLVGVGVSSAAILLFFLLRKDDDEDEDIGRKKKSSAATSHQTVIEMKIPKKAVGAVIGRQGATIKEVQEESGAKINFKDDTQAEDGDRTAIIHGTSEAAQTAECMIRKIIADMPVIVQEQMSVPKYAVGRIIGRGGESIRQMSRASKARILIDKTKDAYRDQPQVITIQGSKQQIDVAKSLIQEKLDEEEEFRAKQAVSAANREVRKPTREHAENHHHHHREGEMITDNENNSFSSPVPSDGKPGTCAEFPKGPEFVEVYVSAIASPGHFWVQVIGSVALQLDRLSVDMTRFYDHEGKDLMLSAVKKGDIVAAPFENDKTWYRAQVMEILPDNKVDLFYVDYGDSTYLDKSFIKHLNTEYLVLPFQAIECRLAGLKPNGEWSEEAFDRFEELTYCAKWKRILAKATKFTGSIPHLELIDTNNYQDVNINEEMIKSGFAVPET